MGKKTNALNNAKNVKNDEFYTLIDDIEAELINYSDKFYGKTVYCNCDDHRESNFFKYFFLNFNKLGLKRLICTGYKKGGRGVMYSTTCGDANGNGIVDINELETSYLHGDGSYDSDECLSLLDESDVVVTNPPFSLFREYIETIMKHEKKFLIIGNLNAIPCKYIFNLIKSNKIWIGCNNVKRFLQPDGTIKNFGNIIWYTNIDHCVRHTKFPLTKIYDKTLYPKYYNYDAIEVSKANDIPKNYDGVMGVPISFMNKVNPSQFKILECHDPAIELEYYKKFPCFKKEYPSRQVKISGILCQKVYHRIFIKKV